MPSGKKKILVSLLTLHYPLKTYQSQRIKPSSRNTGTRKSHGRVPQVEPITDRQFTWDIPFNIAEHPSDFGRRRFRRVHSRTISQKQFRKTSGMRRPLGHRDPRITDTDHLLCITTLGTNPPATPSRAKSPCRVSKSTRPANEEATLRAHTHTTRLHAAITIISIIWRRTASRHPPHGTSRCTWISYIRMDQHSIVSKFRRGEIQLQFDAGCSLRWACVGGSFFFIFAKIRVSSDRVTSE